jgi:hypothetical protein
MGSAPMLAQQAPDRPGTMCNFDGFDKKPALAEVTAPRQAKGYFGCSTGGNCVSTNLAPGDAVLVYRVDGDWTCGYLSQRNGAGPAWVRSRDIHPVSFDRAPALSAWVGNWANGKDRIGIQVSKSPGKLDLHGAATWHGGGGVVHTGDFEGEAVPDGHRLHFVEDSADSCTVDLTLIGEYLLANDNAMCGGMNVRFWGIWKRTGKR